MHPKLTTPPSPLPALLVLAVTAALPLAGLAQPRAPADWRQCSSIAGDDTARLACFDTWARSQEQEQVPARSAPVLAPQPPVAGVSPAAPPPAPGSLQATTSCLSPSRSELSRFWELEQDSDCGTFTIRGYRPISLSWIGSNSVNTAPSSPTADHTAAFRAYETAEMRIQLSVRTKIAQGLLTDNTAKGRDSVWFGYSQQSYWQLFNADLSRPFRSTDHEPELTYIYPTDAALPGRVPPIQFWLWRTSPRLLLGTANSVHQPTVRLVEGARRQRQPFRVGGGQRSGDEGANLPAAGSRGCVVASGPRAAPPLGTRAFPVALAGQVDFPTLRSKASARSFLDAASRAG